MDLTKFYSFPVLEEGRMDYGDECSYKVESIPISQSGGRRIQFQHDIMGKCLVSDLIKRGQARFACIVVLKSTMYRQTFADVGEEKSVSTRQIIPLPDTFESPTFSPMVVYVGENKKIQENKSEILGLSDLWDDREISLLKGAILARTHWKILETTSGCLMKMKRDEKQKYGFLAKISPDEGGRIIIYTAPSLYDAMLQCNNRGPIAGSIHTHMLAAGLAELSKEVSEVSNEQARYDLPNFTGIKEQLEENGITTWEDDNKPFNPHEAAYFLSPSQLPELSQPPSEED